MSCHNCDHTMQNIGDAVFWCNRCGSIRWGNGDYASDVPKIVSRAQHLIQGLDVYLEDEAFLRAIYDHPDMRTALGVESLRECLHDQPTPQAEMLR